MSQINEITPHAFWSAIQASAAARLLQLDQERLAEADQSATTSNEVSSLLTLFEKITSQILGDDKVELQFTRLPIFAQMAACQTLKELLVICPTESDKPAVELAQMVKDAFIAIYQPRL